ncbi:ISL3 family transposase [Streptomyces griseomycini]|uniref:Transposase n=1 Tax=Streptomyces griseomycini TaxID=66895 RepID=A0A7W7PYR4_9ACTN|nr:ISL3 family transposase [Streptomyces griseomycini]MBB4903782.1 transposase [Streptomyces griseomycini]GGR46620.1 transposase [Streptomyces griseomycini]
MLLELFPYLSTLLIEEVERRPDKVVLRARVRSTTGACHCGHSSSRVHGGYVRTLRDAAVGGLGVVIELHIRRFRCENPACTAVTFAEQIAGLTTPHGRYTPLLRGLLMQIGLALAGRAGARLAAAVGITVGRDTLLRMVRALPEPEIGEVEVLGVDDFAFRKGRHYGTVLIDMATHRPLHLYDGREGEDLAAWLQGHPEVKVICRDRSSGYGEGARVGAPQAQQVADRYHLWANLGQAVEKTVNAHRSRLAEPLAGTEDGPGHPEAEPEVVQPSKELKIVTRLREQHAAAHELWAQEMSKAAIGRKLGLHQATVRKLVNARSADDVVAKSLQRAHVVDPYVGYLHRRWNEGIRNAAQLYREIQKLGYPGGELAVQRHLRRYRTGRGHAPAVGPKPPSVREVTSWIMTHPEHLGDGDADRLHRLRERNPELDRLTGHVRKFAVMMTARHGDRLEEWIAGVEHDTLAPLAGFARNLRRDFDAVQNGLSLPHSSGAVEGNINRLKMLKRQMFGRASLDLLRKRVLLAR